MKKIIIVFAMVILTSCARKEFCGQNANQDDFKMLNGQVDTTALLLGMQLSIETARKCGENIKPQFEVLYSVKDTIVMNVNGIENENLAKEISCVIVSNELVNKTKITYVKLNWNQGSKVISLANGR